MFARRRGGAPPAKHVYVLYTSIMLLSWRDLYLYRCIIMYGWFSSETLFRPESSKQNSRSILCDRESYYYYHHHYFNIHCSVLWARLTAWLYQKLYYYTRLWTHPKPSGGKPSKYFLCVFFAVLFNLNTYTGISEILLSQLTCIVFMRRRRRRCHIVRWLLHRRLDIIFYLKKKNIIRIFVYIYYTILHYWLYSKQDDGKRDYKTLCRFGRDIIQKYISIIIKGLREFRNQTIL